MNYPNCDKCGTPVPPENDATIIQDYKTGGKTMWMFPKARHFFAIKDVCEGSPSRAQYIEGQPRSQKYSYDDAHEKAWRDAYDEVQKKYSQKQNAEK